MTNSQIKKEDLKKLISSSLLLSDEDKDFWLANADSLPDFISEKVFNSIQKGETIVKKALDAAIKQDPDQQYLSELKAKITGIKRKAFEIEEKSEEVDVEKLLEEKLHNIEQ